MTNHTDLLEQSFEINLNNYGPEDVERLNDWAINAYAALGALQAEVERQSHIIQGLWMERDAMRAERDAALAQIAALREQALKPERAPLSADAYEALVDDLGEWSRHVVEDTAHITLDTHIRRTLAVHGIKQGGQHD